MSIRWRVEINKESMIDVVAPTKEDAKNIVMGYLKKEFDDVSWVNLKVTGIGPLNLAYKKEK